MKLIWCLYIYKLLQNFEILFNSFCNKSCISSRIFRQNIQLFCKHSQLKEKFKVSSYKRTNCEFSWRSSNSTAESLDWGLEIFLNIASEAFTITLCIAIVFSGSHEHEWGHSAVRSSVLLSEIHWGHVSAHRSWSPCIDCHLQHAKSQLRGPHPMCWSCPSLHMYQSCEFHVVKVTSYTLALDIADGPPKATGRPWGPPLERCAFGKGWGVNCCLVLTGKSMGDLWNGTFGGPLVSGLASALLVPNPGDCSVMFQLPAPSTSPNLLRLVCGRGS